MDYVEKRKNGKKRIFKKMLEENDKKERVSQSKSYPIAMKNDIIYNSIYNNLTLDEKKLYRYILSLIKKSDDINTTFILRHKLIQEIFNHKGFTSIKIYKMLKNVSSSFNLIDITKKGKKQYYHIPVFKMIKTSEDSETTEIIFNEFFNGLYFLNIDKIKGFLQYELGNVLKYRGLHTIELFEIILSKVKANRSDEIVSFDYDIDILKKLLGCDKYATKDFISKIIKKSITEINKYNKAVLGGNVEYKYNKTKKTITFYAENLIYMLKIEKKKYKN